MVKLIQTLPDHVTPANRYFQTDHDDGEYMDNITLQPSIFSDQIATIGAAFNNIELLALRIHWARMSDLTVKGQLAIGFDPAQDATATTTIDQVLRLPNSWSGMIWADKTLEMKFPPGIVTGPVTPGSSSFFPANTMAIRIAIANAPIDTVVGRLWCEAVVRFSGQK